jgi:ABC-type uncharacterized transport system substrate-binding protein
MKIGLIGGCLFWAGLLLITQPVLANSAAILFIAAGDSPLQNQFLQHQRQRYAPVIALQREMIWQNIGLTGFIGLDKMKTTGKGGNGQQRLRHVQAEEPTLTALCRAVDVIVAVGRDAARAAIQDCEAPTLVIFVTQAELTPLLAAATRPNITAIYLEADPVLNLRLIRLMMPKAVIVGVLVSPQSRPWLPRLREEALRGHLQLVEITAADDAVAVSELRRRLDGLDVILLLPETQLVNPWSLKPMLLMAIRQAVPLVGGIIENYVRAGVMAAVVADVVHLPQQVAGYINHLVQGKVPEPAYPTAVQVAINDIVASNLAIETRDREQWLQAVQDPLGTPDASP